ncbi:transcriptional regulator [Pseudomonas protegens]|uniref:Cro/CI family transcriptional regulator n=1 Tax=Pseudomonas sp. W17 TaxID=3144407 RepID=A0AAU7WNT1_9PSED
MFMKVTPLERAIRSAGTGRALANLLGVTPMAVSYWKSRGVPAHQVIPIEKATGVSRCDLRPDLYPAEG